MKYWLLKSEPNVWSIDQQFKAGSKGLGFPTEFQRSWLKDVVFNGNNIYTEKYFTNDKCLCEVLLDVNADIWNNGAFTTVFTW